MRDILSYWCVAIPRRATADSLRFFGGWRSIVIPVFVFIAGCIVRIYIDPIWKYLRLPWELPPMSDEIVVFVVWGLGAVVLLFLMLWIVNLALAPYHIWRDQHREITDLQQQLDDRPRISAKLEYTKKKGVLQVYVAVRNVGAVDIDKVQATVSKAEPVKGPDIARKRKMCNSIVGVPLQIKDDRDRPYRRYASLGIGKDAAFFALDASIGRGNMLTKVAPCARQVSQDGRSEVWHPNPSGHIAPGRYKFVLSVKAWGGNQIELPVTLSLTARTVTMKPV